MFKNVHENSKYVIDSLIPKGFAHQILFQLYQWIGLFIWYLNKHSTSIVHLGQNPSMS